MDVWPAGRDSWRTLWQLPRGLSLDLRGLGQWATVLTVVCEGDTAADKARGPGAVDLGGADRDRLAHCCTGSKASGGPDYGAGRGTVRGALETAQAALHANRPQIAEDTVWLRIPWGTDLSVALSAALDSPEAIHADWLDAGRAADEAKQKRILGALAAYAQAKGTFPRRRLRRHDAPPATRLSWIAAMLPYFEHPDWHRNFNSRIPGTARRTNPSPSSPLEAVINPLVPRRFSESGFPVSHYVGVAGIGKNAGDLKPDDENAGMFGFSRTARPRTSPRAPAIRSPSSE